VGGARPFDKLLRRQLETNAGLVPQKRATNVVNGESSALNVRDEGGSSLPTPAVPGASIAGGSSAATGEPGVHVAGSNGPEGGGEEQRPDDSGQAAGVRDAQQQRGDPGSAAGLRDAVGDGTTSVEGWDSSLQCGPAESTAYDALGECSCGRLFFCIFFSCKAQIVRNHVWLISTGL
jgi:hypothetical protein